MKMKLLKEMLESWIRFWVGSANENVFIKHFTQHNPTMLVEMLDSFSWAFNLKNNFLLEEMVVQLILYEWLLENHYHMLLLRHLSSSVQEKCLSNESSLQDFHCSDPENISELLLFSYLISELRRIQYSGI